MGRHGSDYRNPVPAEYESAAGLIAAAESLKQRADESAEQAQLARQSKAQTEAILLSALSEVHRLTMWIKGLHRERRVLRRQVVRLKARVHEYANQATSALRKAELAEGRARDRYQPLIDQHQGTIGELSGELRSLRAGAQANRQAAVTATGRAAEFERLLRRARETLGDVHLTGSVHATIREIDEYLN